MLELDIHDKGSKQVQILVYWHILAQSAVTEHKRQVVKRSLKSNIKYIYM